MRDYGTSDGIAVTHDPSTAEGSPHFLLRFYAGAAGERRAGVELEFICQREPATRAPAQVIGCAIFIFVSPKLQGSAAAYFSGAFWLATRRFPHLRSVAMISSPVWETIFRKVVESQQAVLGRLEYYCFAYHEAIRADPYKTPLHGFDPFSVQHNGEWINGQYEPGSTILIPRLSSGRIWKQHRDMLDELWAATVPSRMLQRA